MLLSCLQKISLSEIIHRDSPNFKTFNCSVTHWRRKCFSVEEGGGEANLGVDRLLKAPCEAQAIFKIIVWGGAAWRIQPYPLAPPMLHVPISFEISPGRKSISCTSYWSPNYCSIIQLCTYMFLAAVGTLYFVFQSFYLLRNILKWNFATIALSHLLSVCYIDRGHRRRKS